MKAGGVDVLPRHVFLPFPTQTQRGSSVSDLLPMNSRKIGCYKPSPCRTKNAERKASAVVKLHKYWPLMDHCAIRGQQVGDTAAALGWGSRCMAGVPDEAKNLRYIELDKRNTGMETKRKIEEYFRMAFDGISGHQSQPFFGFGEH